MRKHLLTTTAAMLLAMTGAAFADMEAAKKFLDAEVGDMSALDRATQEAEMQWFINAAKPFAGMEIKVVSETITTHEYEAKVLAPAFEAITGIKVTHDLIGEGDVVDQLLAHAICNFAVGKPNSQTVVVQHRIGFDCAAVKLHAKHLPPLELLDAPGIQDRALGDFGRSFQCLLNR